MDIDAAALGQTPHLRARPEEICPVEMPQALKLRIADVFITHELYKRAPKKTDYLREKLALQDLAARMADQSEEVLPRFDREWRVATLYLKKTPWRPRLLLLLRAVT
jgi:hypothetical protein